MGRARWWPRPRWRFWRSWEINCILIARRISEGEQAGYDFDWFAVDRDDYLIQFASCGGFLSESVAASKENLLTLKEFFSTLPELSTDEEIILTSAAFGDSSSFLHYVRRGFYSFDKMVLNISAEPFYHLIAQPLRPMVLADLPVEIAVILTHTRFPFSVANLSIIDVTTIS